MIGRCCWTNIHVTSWDYGMKSSSILFGNTIYPMTKLALCSILSMGRDGFAVTVAYGGNMSQTITNERGHAMGKTIRKRNSNYATICVYEQNKPTVAFWFTPDMAEVMLEYAISFHKANCGMETEQQTKDYFRCSCGTKVSLMYW